MSQDNHDRPPIAVALARKTEGGDAHRVAVVVTTAMGAIEASLSPVIGKGGVVAMYRRSLLLVAAAHPWLTRSDSPRNEIDLPVLRSLLAGQDPSAGAAAGAALLQTFCDLLASLVGSSLSERLLRNVWADLDSPHRDHLT